MNMANTPCKATYADGCFQPLVDGNTLEEDVWLKSQPKTMRPTAECNEVAKRDLGLVRETATLVVVHFGRRAHIVADGWCVRQ